MRKLQWLQLGMASVLLAFSASTSADTFPSGPIRLVVGYSAGGGSDSLARTLAKGMSERLKQSVIVENRPGASTLIAAQSVQSAKPDGYTIFQVDVGTLAMNQFLFTKLPYDPAKFEPLAQVAVNTIGVVVPSDSKYKSVTEFVEAAKAKELTVASAGPGNITHLAMEQFQRRVGVKFTHVPYKGSAPALQALMAGEVDAYFSDIPSAISFVRGGKLKYLAMMSEKRVEALPDVPTFQESNYSDLVIGVWIGVVAPPGTDPAVKQKLSQAILDAANGPDVLSWMRVQSSTHSPATGEQFKAVIEADALRYGSIIKSIGLKLD